MCSLLSRTKSMLSSCLSRRPLWTFLWWWTTESPLMPAPYNCRITQVEWLRSQMMGIYQTSSLLPMSILIILINRLKSKIIKISWPKKIDSRLLLTRWKSLMSGGERSILRKNWRLLLELWLSFSLKRVSRLMENLRKRFCSKISKKSQLWAMKISTRSFARISSKMPLLQLLSR